MLAADDRLGVAREAGRDVALDRPPNVDHFRVVEGSGPPSET